MRNTLRGIVAAIALALFGHAAAAQSAIDSPGYFTFELQTVEQDAAPYLDCFAARTCTRATKLPTGNVIARQVYEDLHAGRIQPYRGATDAFFYVYGSSGRGADRIYVQDGQGVRLVQAVRGCTNVTNIPALGGPPEYCFHLQGSGELKIAFPRDFFSGHTYAAWCMPYMANGVRPTPGEGIPYVKEEINDKLAGKGGWPYKTVTFALVRGGYAQAPVAYAPPRYY